MRKNKVFSFICPAVLLVLLAFSNQEDYSSLTQNNVGNTAEATEVYNYLFAYVGNMDYRVMQGGCTDGTYAYYVMENQAVSGSMCELVKMRISDWSIVKVVTGIDINHGNDLTYNPKTKKIIAVHNKPNYNVLSIIDPETLKIESDISLKIQVFSIGYDESRDQYVVGLSGGTNFDILDSQFNVVQTCIGQETDYTRQGMDCDEQYIYFVQSETDCYDNHIVVYDWNGNYIKTITVDVALEGESLCHVGSVFYMNFNSSQYKGTVYQLKLPLN